MEPVEEQVMQIRIHAVIEEVGVNLMEGYLRFKDSWEWLYVGEPVPFVPGDLVDIIIRKRT